MINPLLPSKFFFQKSLASVTDLFNKIIEEYLRLALGVLPDADSKQAFSVDMVAAKTEDEHEHDIAALKKALRDAVAGPGGSEEIMISKRQLKRILRGVADDDDVAALVDTIWGTDSLWKVWFPRDG